MEDTIPIIMMMIMMGITMTMIITIMVMTTITTMIMTVVAGAKEVKAARVVRDAKEEERANPAVAEKVKAKAVSVVVVNFAVANPAREAVDAKVKRPLFCRRNPVRISSVELYPWWVC